jgi:transmembrane sensor
MRAEQIEQDAAQWLAARDAESWTPEREAHLQAWLAASDRHAAAFLRLQTCWGEADRFRALRVADGPLNLDLLETKGPRHHAVALRFWVTVAACVLIGTGVLFEAYQQWGTQSYRTAVGGVARIPLADGSVLTLNTASEVRVQFTPARREVTLVRGEALFNVAHDPNRAFDVQAGSRTIRAVGTAFSVRRLGGDDVKVVVTSGQVAIVPPNIQLAEIKVSALPSAVPTVSAGESAEIGEHGALSVRELGAAAQQAVSWTQGRLWFDRVTLTEAVGEFNRYNRRQFVIDDPNLGEIHIGGTFDAQDIASFAAALRTFGIKIDESDPDTLKLSKAEH